MAAKASPALEATDFSSEGKPWLFGFIHGAGSPHPTPTPAVDSFALDQTICQPEWPYRSILCMQPNVFVRTHHDACGASNVHIVARPNRPLRMYSHEALPSSTSPSAHTPTKNVHRSVLIQKQHTRSNTSCHGPVSLTRKKNVSVTTALHVSHRVVTGGWERCSPSASASAISRSVCGGRRRRRFRDARKTERRKYGAITL